MTRRFDLRRWSTISARERRRLSEWPSHRGHEERSVALIEALAARLRIPSEYRELAVIVARYHGIVHRAFELKPKTILEFMERADAFRRPERFAQALLACEADSRGRAGLEDRALSAARLPARRAPGRRIDQAVRRGHCRAAPEPRSRSSFTAGVCGRLPRCAAGSRPLRGARSRSHSILRRPITACAADP